MDKLVQVEKSASVAWMVLNSAENMNALSRDLIEQLDDEVARLARDPEVRCVVITGAGSAFSAGGDLAGFKADLAEPGTGLFIERLDAGQKVLNRIEALPMPVIAAVNGYAIAGGLELLLCCDLVFAARSARIGDGHARYGIIPAAGASVRLPRKIASNRANLMFFTGDLFTAEVLAEWGLINEVVADDQLTAVVRRCAESIARRSPLGLSWMKTLARDNIQRAAVDGGKAEIEAFRHYAGSRDLAEGLAAFAEKRAPSFEGK